MLRRLTIAFLGSAACAMTASAAHEPGIEAFRALYKELIEINTTLSSGSCTAAAEAMSAQLKSAGFTDNDIRLIVPPEAPKQGNLIATLAGTDAAAKPMLLLAHIDVVEAKREDWVRDPFVLVEENGQFYARGASDDKGMATIFVDTMMRFKKEGYQPRRAIRLALTCGEESSAAVNGVKYLIANHRDLIDAAFALNEGAGGKLDEAGKHVSLGIQAGEKVYQDYTLEVTNAGGHSSRPVKDNAIYHLAAGLERLGAYDFPIHLNDATKAYFTAMSALETGKVSEALKAVVANEHAEAAVRVIVEDPSRNSMMRTTCVATMVEAGHAQNALPQRAKANVNCRILPGVSQEDVKNELIKVLADDQIKVTLDGAAEPTAPVPPLGEDILKPVRDVGQAIWPGVPLIPVMAIGATDGRFLNAVGIPTYGLSGIFSGPDGSGAHGLNEHIGVEQLYDGRDFLYRVVKIYAQQD